MVTERLLLFICRTNFAFAPLFTTIRKVVLSIMKDITTGQEITVDFLQNESLLRLLFSYLEDVKALVRVSQVFT